MNVTQIELRI